MESDKSISVPLDGHNEAIQRIRPLHGRTSGPTRRSTKGQWTAEEDEILRKAVQRFKGKNWKKIAECFKDRTDVQCLHRWQKVLNPELVKGPWSKEEDEMMIELVNRYGPKKWSTIAQHLPGRIGKQCRERWHNHLNPNINKEAWTQQEELALIRAHQVYGNRWAELTKFLPGRTDNAIKNHWNSSVKKKLDSYLASGLLEQFQGLPLVAHQNQPMPSSSSRVQSSGDNTDPRNGIEAEEISECSQGSTVAGCSQSMSGLGNAAFHGREEFQLREDPGVAREQSSSPASCSDHYFTSVGDVPFSIPEQVPLEVGCSSNFLPQNFSQNPAIHQGGINNPTCIGPITENSSNPDCMLIPEDECCQYLFSDELNGETFSSGNVNKELNSVARMEPTSNVLLSESIKVSHLFSPSKYGELVTTSGPSEENQMVDQFFTANEQDIGISAQDGFIYTNCTASSPCDGDLKEPPKLVPVNSFASDTNTTHSSPVKEIPTTQLKPDDGGSLCYEPPRFPSLDIPFLSCDLVHSGSDIQQEYSPLGIRQLMMSSMNCLTPFRLWDSPTQDGSPDAVLKSAAKTFAGTPSILKKRSRDLMSPLSDRRIDKKLDLASSLTKEFSKLDVVFGDSDMNNSSVFSPSNMKVDNASSVEDKENLDPSLESGEQKGRISDKDGHSNSLDDTKQGTVNVEQPPAVITEDGANDVLFFSPDQVGFKADRAFAPSSRTPKNLYRIILGTLSEQAAASEMASGNVSSPAKCKHSADQSVASTSGPSNTVDDNRNDATTDNTHSMLGGTPFRRSIESPSAWKSPWFMNSFIPGPRVDTDITIEDIGYFMSPGDRSYDAIALMKQLSEQNASAYADALNVLGNETPETLLEKRRSSCQIEDQETKNTPDSHKLESDARLASNFLSECRTLDFSECETPGKKGTERTKSATCVSLTSPSSYLLKSCR